MISLPYITCYPLGLSDTFRQRVLAFDIWTAYSSSREVQADGTIANRPPTYAGATLVGLCWWSGPM